MRFGFPPSNPRFGPVFNFRSEGRRFDKSNRCLVPASAFFEFTGKKYPKAKHRFALAAAPFMAIAGLWREGQGNQPPSFTMLTTAPGPDVAPYHDRQVAVLRPTDWAAWINLTAPNSRSLLQSLACSWSFRRRRSSRGVGRRFRACKFLCRYGGRSAAPPRQVLSTALFFCLAHSTSRISRLAPGRKT
jgi:putative SOS response-associated peptidase YedK